MNFNWFCFITIFFHFLQPESREKQIPNQDNEENENQYRLDKTAHNKQQITGETIIYVC